MKKQRDGTTERRERGETPWPSWFTNAPRRSRKLRQGGEIKNEDVNGYLRESSPGIFTHQLSPKLILTWTSNVSYHVGTISATSYHPQPTDPRGNPKPSLATHLVSLEIQLHRSGFVELREWISMVRYVINVYFSLDEVMKVWYCNFHLCFWVHCTIQEQHLGPYDVYAIILLFFYF